MGQQQQIITSNTVLLAVPDLFAYINDIKNAEGVSVNVLLCDVNDSLVDTFQANSDRISAVIIPQDIDLMLLEKLSHEINKIEKEQLLPLLIIGHVEPRMLSVLRSGVFFQSLTLEEAKIKIQDLLETTVSDSIHVKSLLNDIENTRRVLNLMTQGSFEFKTLKESDNLATFLSSTCPKPRLIALGLSELMVNAVEHGNLGIDFEEKTRLLDEGVWLQEIDNRAIQPDYQDRKVIVTFERHDNYIEINITDDGEGFDWRPYISFSRERLTMKHGRGIAIAKETVFDDLNYNDKGNSVTVRIEFS